MGSERQTAVQQQLSDLMQWRFEATELEKVFTLSSHAQSKAFLLLKVQDDVRLPSLMSSLHAFICSIYFSCTSFHLSFSQFTTPDSGLVANQNTLAPPLRALPCLSYTLSSDLSPLLPTATPAGYDTFCLQFCMWWMSCRPRCCFILVTSKRHACETEKLLGDGGNFLNAAERLTGRIVLVIPWL